MKIALDIMSGDKAPNCNINGAINFIKNPLSQNTHVVLYGTEKILKNNSKLLKKHSDRISFIITKDIITMDDKPSHAFKNKRNSSLIKIIDDLKEEQVSGAISSGNTGALLTASLLILGKIEGIKRPALAPYIPIKGSGFILCDAGANATVKPEHLYQFAIMSSAYLEHQGLQNKPKVGLLNIGSEPKKGNELTIESYKILEEKLPNFIGNLESRELFDKKADIILCDGFTGNIVLKLIEGLINKMIKHTIQSVDSHSLSKMAKPILYPVFDDIKKAYDYEEHGGTLLLGVNGVVMKCHGASNAKAIENALLKTQKSIDTNLIPDIKSLLKTDPIIDEINKI
tara:strand:+ start:156 stop:1181 length:1026 start_codon:yes stop_codon:yes gene_type:complete